MSKNLKIIVIVGLLVIAVIMTVAYAALSKKLTINGAASINSNTWNIELIVQPGACVTTGSATVGIPTVDGTIVTLNDVVLNKPGDKVTCTIDVKNSGSIDAKLESFNVKEPTYGTTNSDTIMKNNSTYLVTYEGIEDPLSSSTTKELVSDDTKQVVISYEFNRSTTSVPSEMVTVNNLGVSLTYVQA